MINTQNSTLAEQASNNNGPKRAKAKEIFLGIDAHLHSNQVAQKIDNSAIGPVENLALKSYYSFAASKRRWPKKSTPFMRLALWATSCAGV